MRTLRAIGVVVMAACACTTGLVRVPASASPVPEVHGIQLLADTVLPGDGRLHELTLHSAALGHTTKVRLLLPADYADPTAATKRYPMLLMLHGASGNERSWTEGSDIEGYAAGLGLIAVMPDGGLKGFYSDWLDGPKWETYHLQELVPWVDATYRTLGTRAGRAVVGLSMGGFGSMVYAARHPDLFVTAASFSGAVNIADLSLAEAAALQALGYGDDLRWGPYATHEINWRGHNPPDLASNLRGMPLRLTTGTGVPCPGDNPSSSFLETGVSTMNAGFVARLALVGIAPDFTLRPCGTHQWHYWDADIAAWLPGLMAIFAAPPRPPAAFDYRTTEPSAAVWGWSFTTHRPAQEFLDLRAVSPAGLTATGSGLLDILTPPVYDPGATYSVNGGGAGVVTVPLAVVPPVVTVPGVAPPPATVAAGPDGRLAFTLDLGPAHTADQYSPEGVVAEAAGIATYFRTVTVGIAEVAAPAAAPVPTVGAVVAAGTIPATGAPPPPWGLVAAAVAIALGMRRVVARA